MNKFVLLFLLASGQPDQTITLPPHLLHAMMDLVYCAAWSDAVEMQKSLYDVRRQQMGDERRAYFDHLRGAVDLPEKCPRMVPQEPGK